MRPVPMLIVLAVLTVVGGALEAAEKPQPLSDAQADAIAGKAPKCPMNPVAAMDLKLCLIDFIDCTAAKDPHDFRDQGTSKVVTGPAGRYRQTAAHRHAFFAYRFRSAGKDKPVLIVFEYPDDAVRTINFSTHESGLRGRANSDWSLETGVYCGDPQPLSMKMQYHTFIMWAQDQWPCALVGNWHRYGHPAAASRIWVYAIEAPLPKLQVDAPDPADQRRLGHYNSRGYYLAQRLYFGLRSPNAVEHMLDYFQYIGVNELSWGIVHSDDATIPSWGLAGPHLEEVLSGMDRREGMGFMASFFLGDTMKIGGKAIKDLSAEELKAGLCKGFGEFLDRYGKFKSLRGIALGGQYGISCIHTWRDKGVVDDVVRFIKAKRPDLQVFTYVGGWNLHVPYFDGNHNPATPEDVVARWEKSGAAWSDFLGDETVKMWQRWKIDADTLRGLGLEISEQYQPDDPRIFDNYGGSQQPRSTMYFDVDNSQRRSDHLATPYANIWNTHYEGWYGLNPEVNFWYQKHWVAPDFNAPPPLSLFVMARVLGHRDRLAIVPGSWNNRFFGWEASARRFARAFRSLPPVTMKDVETGGLDAVKVRWTEYKGKRYVAVVNRTPFAATVTVDGREVALGPYDLVTLVDNKSAAPRVAGKPSDVYVKWIGDRIAQFEKLCAEVKATDAKAVPDVYAKTAAEAHRTLAAGCAYAADLALAPGLVAEMQLRKDILNPPQLQAPRVAAAPAMNSDLDAWPKEASDLRAEGGEYLPTHTYYPNSWTGPEDLSARLRFCHDGRKLYLGIEVRDSVVAEYEDNWNRYDRTFKRADGCQMRLSTDGAYLDWMSAADQVKSDLSWSIAVPLDGKDTSGEGRAGFTYTCRRTPKGYVFEGSASLAELKARPGGSIGFLLVVSDVDKTHNIKGSGWAAKQALLVPHKPNFVFWSDVRNCGRLVFGQ